MGGLYGLGTAGESSGTGDGHWANMSYSKHLVSLSITPGLGFNLNYQHPP